MGTESGRLHYIDSLRAALMMLGVVLHSAQVYNPRQEWLIHGEQGFWAAAWVADAIGFFRMPAFFMVAGFFCVVSLRRLSPDRFAAQRLERLGIPLLVCALLLNSVQVLILVGATGADFDLHRYWFSGDWMSHLWFLNHLLVFVSITWWVARVRPAYVFGPGRRLLDRLARAPAVPLLAGIALLHLGMMKVGNLTGFWALGVVGGLLHLFSLFFYVPMFAFGIALALRPELLRRFVAVPPAIGLLAVVGGVMVVDAADAADTALARLGAQYVKVAAAWYGSALCFYLFRRFADRPSALTNHLSDASYSVYLFHHLFVIVFAVPLVTVGLDGRLAMPLLVAAVLAATLVVHRVLVASNPYGRFLFNGIRPARRARVAAAQRPVGTR